MYVCVGLCTRVITVIYIFIMLRSYITDICNAPAEGGWFGVRFAGHEIS